jgi:hypothetical protein
MLRQVSSSGVLRSNSPFSRPSLTISISMALSVAV